MPASREKLQEYLHQIKDLTIVPPVLIQIVSLPDDNELSFKEMANMVQSDQILTSRLLKLANSPFYNRGNRITSLRDVIVRLGFRIVRSMIFVALSDSIFQEGNYRKFRDEVWFHSIAKGVFGAKECERVTGLKESDMALVGGLLQDLGKIILNTIDRKKYIEVLNEFLETGTNIREIEIRHFGVDHAAMGVAAARMWKLPDNIVRLIADRHLDPDKRTAMGTFLTFADLAVRRVGFGSFTQEHEAELQSVTTDMDFPVDEDFFANIKDDIEGDELFKFSLTL